MSGGESAEKSLVIFKEEYIRNRRDINTYRKLKKYSKVGLYTSALLIYITAGLLLSNDFSITSALSIGFSTITLISIILTLLFRLNLRRYDYDEYDIVYHEIAAFIEDSQQELEEAEIEENMSRFYDRVIDEDSGVVPKRWKDELDSYFSYIDENENSIFEDTFPAVFGSFVQDMYDIEEVSIREEYKREDVRIENSRNEDPGFFDIVADSISSDVVSKNTIVWVVFALAVGGGLALAFIQGQGWGVLLVTIVFGGLRLYDQQRE